MTWIQTRSGKSFDFTPTGIQRSEICIEDIASSLSKICRFVGHCSRFYSVAEHSVHASHAPDLTLYGAWCALLHDAQEAYVGDVSSPLKMLLPDYRRIELAVEAKVQAYFCTQYHPSIRMVDLRMLMTERNALIPESTKTWDATFTKFNPYSLEEVSIQCWTPSEAQEKFFQRFASLHAALIQENILSFDPEKGYTKLKDICATTDLEMMYIDDLVIEP